MVTLPASVNFLHQLCMPARALRVRRAVPALDWNDRALHEELYRDNPVRYALHALATEVSTAQKARLLLQLLAASRQGYAPEVRGTLDQIVTLLLAELPAETVLTVFLGLRRTRANHKHTTRAIVHYLLNHPCIEHLAVTRRPTVADCLEHALGRNVVRGAVRRLHEDGTAADYAARHLLCWIEDVTRAVPVLLYLYGYGPAPQVPAEVIVVEPRATPELPKTVTATNRGDIAATLVHLYQGGESAELRQALTRFVAEAASALPRFTGTVALVFDASTSTVGYGERRFCCLAQSMALRLLLKQCAARVQVHVVGGTDDAGLARPDGDTDLATALLDALAGDPDVVAIVSDGYENVAHGDLADVVASLPGTGVEVPVVFCQSKFTHKDDLTYRVPVPALPQVEFWHQTDLPGVLWTLFASARAPHGERFLLQQLQSRMHQCRKEARP